MSEDCTHNCSTCNQDCGDRTPKSLLEKPHATSHIRKVIGVVSGKGGVGKSLITSMLAVLANRKGLKTAILDADITGPSIPTRVRAAYPRRRERNEGFFPVPSETGIQIMSLNLLTENETDPVVWRGPMIAGSVKQFWTDVLWGSVD